MLKSRSLLLLSLVLAVGAGAESPAPSLEQQAEQLKPFKQLLKGALQNGLSGGTLAAMEACQLMAPAIQTNLTSAVVEVGRASHKPRNAGNGIQPWMEAAHQGYLQGDNTPKQVGLDEGAIGYIEPITVQPGCLQCHGTVLAPEVREYLAEHYPGDRASGFAVGDYRGFFWMKSIPPKSPL